MQQPSEPIFNVPAVLVALVAVLAVLHGAREYLLPDEADRQILLQFAFIPVRFDTALASRMGLPTGAFTDALTFVSYAFLHASWTHLLVNAVWLVPFGAALARRFGALRFTVFFLVTAAGGAAMHLATNLHQIAPVIGASAAVSGCMSGAMRFAFQRGGPLETWRGQDAAAYHVPAAPLFVALRNPRVLTFVLIWFAVNILFGVGFNVVPGSGDQEIAWQAHIGGFLAGLILFPIFDRAALPPPAPDENEITPAS